MVVALAINAMITMMHECDFTSAIRVAPSQVLIVENWRLIADRFAILRRTDRAFADAW